MRSLAPFTLLVLAGCGIPTVELATGIGGGSQVVGKGPLVSKARPAKAVRQILVSGGVELELRSGSPSLTVSAQNNLQPLVKTEFKNGVLTIHSEGSYSTDKSVKAIVRMPSLSSLSVSGGSQADVQGFRASPLDLSAMGGAEILWKGDATELTAEATGGATIRLRGRARSGKLVATGAGAVDIDRLEGGDLSLELSGASRSSVPGRAAKLRVEASGASEANLGTLSSDHATLMASGASTIKIGRTTGGKAEATGASRIEYRGRLNTISGDASDIISK